MVIITKDTQKVKVDLTAVPQGLTKYKIVYILRNKGDFIWLESNDKWVEIVLTDGHKFRLDMLGQCGLPVTSIDGEVPLDNNDLCEKLANLKLL